MARRHAFACLGIAVAALLVLSQVQLGARTPPAAQGGFALAPLPVDQSVDKPPLRVLGIRGNGKRDYLLGVTVKNVSAREVLRYRLAWHFRDAVDFGYGFDGGYESYGYSTGKAVQTRLNSGGEETSPAQGVLPMDVNAMLREKGAKRRVVILVGVAEVIFADGSRWTADPKYFERIERPVAAATAQSPR